MDIHIFPQSVAAKLVNFYNYAAGATAWSEISADFETSLQNQLDLLPREMMDGRITCIQLDKFLASGFDENTDLQLSTEEVTKAAQLSNYPLDRIAAERGINLSNIDSLG